MTTALAQSNAEPPMFQCPECGEEIPHKSACAPPRPDASAEPAAIERARYRISVVIDTLEAGGQPANWERNCIRFLNEAWEALSFRARAADRSGK